MQKRIEEKPQVTMAVDKPLHAGIMPVWALRGKSRVAQGSRTIGAESLILSAFFALRTQEFAAAGCPGSIRQRCSPQARIMPPCLPRTLIRRGELREQLRLVWLRRDSDSHRPD
jgi:hypothetical protein